MSMPRYVPPPGPLVAILSCVSLDDNLAGAWLVSSFVRRWCAVSALCSGWFGWSLGALALFSRVGGLVATIFEYCADFSLAECAVVSRYWSSWSGLALGLSCRTAHYV